MTYLQLQIYTFAVEEVECSAIIRKKNRKKPE